ncbi:MAG: hypothetical protein PHP64_01645 [Actinomycetota bacterium]|nr:hypothetical protein [Actinomycetota bacterium]
MNCRKARRLLVDFEKKKLKGKTEDDLLLHIKDCQRCMSLCRKLETSSLALSEVTSEKIPEGTAANILEAIQERKGNETREKHKRPFLSLKNLTTAGAVAILVAVAIVAGISLMEKPAEKASFSTQEEKSTKQGKVPSKYAEEEAPRSHDFVSTPGSTEKIFEPLVKITDNNYNKDTLREFFDKSALRKEIAKRFTVASAITLRANFEQEIIDKFLDIQSEGNPKDIASQAALTQVIMSYLISGEPVQLPVYLEYAKFNGENAVIIGLAGPRFGSKSNRLKRFDVWVLAPQRFLTNRDSSIMFFLQFIEK